MKKLSILLISAIIILSGCGTNIGTTPFATNYKTGTGGIEARFLQGSPPSIVFEDRPFEISIELKNTGGYDVVADQGVVNIITDPASQLLEASEQTFSAEGKSLNNPQGAIDVKTFQAKAAKIPSPSEQQDSTIQAQICYPYQTDLSASICIDTDIENKLAKKPCKLTNPSFSGQGAPVAVTNVQTELIPLGDKIIPRFTLTVANKGSGQVVQDDLVHTLCQPGAGQRFLPLIKIEEALISDRSLNCRPTELRLDQEDKIVCTYDQGFPLTLTPFTTLLNVKLKYGYFQTTSKKITVKK